MSYTSMVVPTRTIHLAFHVAGSSAGSLTSPGGTQQKHIFSWKHSIISLSYPKACKCHVFRIAIKSRKIILSTRDCSQCAVSRLKTYSRCLSMRECAVISHSVKWATPSGVFCLMNFTRCSNPPHVTSQCNCHTRMNALRAAVVLLFFRWHKWGPQNHRFVTGPQRHRLRDRMADPSLT